MKAILACSFAAAALLFFLVTFFLFQQNANWLLTVSGSPGTVSEDDSAYVSIPPVTVSLQGRSTHFCKAGFTLQVHKSNIKQIQQGTYLKFIQDSIIDILSSYPIRHLQSHEGKMRLKQHIRNDINRDFSAPIVQDIYFRKFILE